MKKILYVYAPAGPPLDYSFPKIARRGEVTTCIISPPSAYNLEILKRHSKRLIDLSEIAPVTAMQEISTLAEKLRPDVIFTFSEFLLKGITAIAEQFGLRCVGPNVELARNKIAMRECWHKAGVPQPAFRAIRSTDDIGLIKELRYPVLVKLAYGAGSIGQQIVRQPADIDGAIARLLSATEAARALGKHEFSERHDFPQLIAEEIICSTTDSWYDAAGYGDYLSVEGLVKGGVYYPLAMTGRLRTIEPFTELGNVAPCIIAPDKKDQLVELIALAVNALEFEDCATHTELKLMADGAVSFLETAARMGGVAIAKELDEVFGLDYVDLFIGVLIGDESILPAFEAAVPRKAAASVAIMGCDSHGRPWSQSRAFLPDAVDWYALVDGLATIYIEQAQSMPFGGEIKPYDAYGGVLNYAGQAFLVAEHPADLRKAAYLLLDRLEHSLPPFASANAALNCPVFSEKVPSHE
jgi:biotin carboxylase